MSVYRIELTPDDNDTFLVTCPLLPEVTTFCEDKTHWQLAARPAVEEALAARVDHGLEAPAENAGEGEHLLVMPLLLSLKVDLYNAMRTAKVTKAELARRMGLHPTQVDRLLKLDHQTQLETVADAFRALKYDVQISIKPPEAA